MNLDRVLQAIGKWQIVKTEYDKAREDHGDYSWDWAGSHLTAYEKARQEVHDAIKDIIRQAVEEIKNE